MLDKYAETILNVINQQSPDGSYKILSVQELIGKIPEKTRPDAAALKKIVEYLTEELLAVCKYSDENNYCLASTPKGRVYSEKRTEEQVKDKRDKRYQIATLVTSAIGGFIGALAAILLAFAFGL